MSLVELKLVTSNTDISHRHPKKMEEPRVPLRSASRGKNLSEFITTRSKRKSERKNKLPTTGALTLLQILFSEK